MKNIVFFLILGITPFFCEGDSYLLAQILFYFYVLFFTVNFLDFKNFISINMMWNLGFFYMIVGEGVSDLNLHLQENTYKTISFFIFSNSIINVFYFLFRLRIPKVYRNFESKEYYISSRKFNVIILLWLFFLFIEGAIAWNSFMYGRLNAGGGSIYNMIFRGVGFILPNIFYYYYTIQNKKSSFYSLFYSVPIFLVFFLSGTRYYFLFSILGFVIFYVLNLKSIKNRFSIIAISGGLILSSSLLMKTFRDDSSKIGFVKLQSENLNFTSLIAKKFLSNEGVINMCNILFSHFEHNDHLYGKSSLFITYFWFPRSLWPNKPTMIGSWFSKEYLVGVSDSHSVSFGYIGDLYADFGYFSFFIFPFLGILLSLLQNRVLKSLNSLSFESVFVFLFFPYTFFFVRDPITATMSLLGAYFIYYLYRKILKN